MKKLIPIIFILSLVWADEKSDLIMDLEQSLWPHAVGVALYMTMVTRRWKLKLQAW